MHDTCRAHLGARNSTDDRQWLIWRTRRTPRMGLADGGRILLAAMPCSLHGYEHPIPLLFVYDVHVYWTTTTKKVVAVEWRPIWYRLQEHKSHSHKHRGFLTPTSCSCGVRGAHEPVQGAFLLGWRDKKQMRKRRLTKVPSVTASSFVASLCDEDLCWLLIVGTPIVQVACLPSAMDARSPPLIPHASKGRSCKTHALQYFVINYLRADLSLVLDNRKKKGTMYNILWTLVVH